MSSRQDERASSLTEVPGLVGQVPSGKGRAAHVRPGAARDAPSVDVVRVDEEVGSMETTTATTTPVRIPEAERLEPIHTKGLQRVFGLLRIAMGWTFLWAFLDKAFALGFSTGRVVDEATGATTSIQFFGDAAWINGGSPTAGVLGFAMKGPFVDVYQSITGFQMTDAGPVSAAWVDWVYMGSMLLIGLALILGIGVKLASVGGIVWMAIFYTATAIWPEHNPFLDDHVIEAVVLAGLFLANAGRYYGLGKVWQRTEIVQRHPILA
jgi:thiosulfate dehydrogenase [quinone] large subunit